MLELVAKARGERAPRAGAERERRRCRPASSATKSARPSASTARLGHAHAHRVPSAVEQPISPTHLPRACAPDLHAPISRHVQRGRDGAVDDEHHLARVSPWRHRTSPSCTVRRRTPRASSDQVRLLASLEERHGGEEVDGLAVRHPGRASRTRGRPGVSSAVSIEYSGTSSQVESSVVSGSEAMITRAGRIAGRHLPARRRARRTRRRSRTRGSRTAGRSRASRPRAGTSRSRTRTGWRPRRGRC